LTRVIQVLLKPSNHLHRVPSVLETKLIVSTKRTSTLTRGLTNNRFHSKQRTTKLSLPVTVNESTESLPNLQVLSRSLSSTSRFRSSSSSGCRSRHCVPFIDSGIALPH